MLPIKLAGKPEIDACNLRFEKKNGKKQAPEEEFFVDELEWED